MSTGAPAIDPGRYFDAAGELSPVVDRPPVCLYLETTNRCNLLCTTCPRTFEDLEPPADMSWELFTRIVDQVPDIARVVLHGVGEPMMVNELPRMIRYLKERGIYVLFNTNGTLLTEARGQELIDTGLDELRVSLDAADAASFEEVRGRRLLRPHRAPTSARSPRCSAQTGRRRCRASRSGSPACRRRCEQLPAFVQLAHDLGVREVYLQRLVYFPGGQGLARPESALFENLRRRGAGDPRGGAERSPRALGIASTPRARPSPSISLHRAHRRPAVVAVPAAVDADVLHRARPGDPLLHRAVLAARLRELHPRRRDAADAARDLERRRATRTFRGGAGQRPPADVLRELRAALEPLSRAACASPPSSRR